MLALIGFIQQKINNLLQTNDCHLKGIHLLQVFFKALLPSGIDRLENCRFLFSFHHFKRFKGWKVSSFLKIKNICLGGYRRGDKNDFT